MSLIYLKSLALEHFRSFTDRTVIEFPAEAGINIISGPNGLGKTTLLEAIEWALTGRIRRLPDMDEQGHKKVLTTLKSNNVVHRAHLVFSSDQGNEYAIDAHGTNVTPDRADIARFLKKDRWNTINDVGAYLGITHFLSQSPVARLTAQSPEQRWKDWSPTVGMEEIERIAENLDERTSDHIAIFHAKFNNELRDFEAKLDTLEHLQRRMNDFARHAQTVGALSLDQVRVEVERTIAALDRTRGTVTTIPDGPDQALMALSGEIDHATAEVRLRKGRLPDLRSILQRYLQVATEYAAAINAKAETDRQLAAIRAREYTVAADWQSAKDDATVVQERHKEQLTQRDQLFSLDRARHDLERIERNLRSAELDVGRFRKDLVDHENSIAIANARKEELRRIEGQERELSRLVEESSRLDDPSIFLRARSDSVRDAQQLKVVRDQLEVLAGNELLLKQEMNVAKSELEFLESELSETEKHKYALINCHRPGEPCPVCDSQVSEEKFRGKAGTAISAPRLDQAHRRLHMAQSRLRDHDTEQSAARALAADIERRLRDHQRLIADWEARNDVFRSQPIVRALGGRQVTDQLTEQLNTAKRTKYNLLMQGGGEPSKLIATLEMQRTTVSERLAAREKELEELRRQREGGRAMAGMISGSEPLSVEVLAAAMAKASREVAELDRLRATSSRVFENHDIALADIRRAAADLARHAAQAENHLAVMTRQRDIEERAWQHQGLSTIPSVAGFEMEMEFVRRLEQEVDRAGQDYARIKEGYDKWRGAEEYTLASKELTDFCSNRSPGDCRTEWQTLADDRRRKIDKCTKAAETLIKMRAAIDSGCEDFYKNILKPLQDVAKDFDAAYSPPGGHQIDITSQDKAVRLLISGLPADQILSEGQLGVKSISYLLGASIIYPWSRWPALILDDPLQYNDLLHKSDFMDVLRSLVKERHYQVLLSTHDLEEAEYIKRKCVGANIPVSWNRLRHGKNGPEAMPVKICS